MSDQQPLGFLLAPDTPANDNLSEHLLKSDIQSIENAVAESFDGVLGALKIDITDPHTANTARRYAKMLVREVCRGRFEPPPSFTTFPNTNTLDEVVAIGPITIRSLCSHHFCPVLGKAWVGYIPNERLAGLSKFSRVVDWFAARPQVQEEMMKQIADFLEEHLQPKGLVLVVDANHTCMTWRGVRENSDALMSTSLVRGAFRDKPEARQEFFELVRGR